VEKVGDYKMSIDWLKNGSKFENGYSVNMINDFGLVVLDMEYKYDREYGE
jgi:hypothetical protein